LGLDFYLLAVGFTKAQGVPSFLQEALLQQAEKYPPPLFVQVHATPTPFHVGPPHFSSAKGRDHHRIHNRNAKLLHEVQGQGGLAARLCMEIPHLGMKPCQA